MQGRPFRGGIRHEEKAIPRPQRHPWASPRRFLLGIMAALALAHIGLQTYQARTGLPGGELTIIPAFALFFYVGWTAREGSLRRKADHQKGGKHCATGTSGRSQR